MPIQTPQEDPNYYSEEVQEIITDVPHWILRWGLSIFLLVLVSIILFASLIRMPDKVSGKLKIESANKPEEIIPNTNGKLTRLFVKENMIVDSGTILGYIEGNAKPEQVIKIAKLTDSVLCFILKNNLDALSELNLSSPEHLGELQSFYLSFSTSLIDFRSFLTNGIYDEKRRLISSELADLKLQNVRLNNQIKIYQQDFEIAEKEFEANKKLLEGKVISQMEYKREESKYINKKIPLENIASSILGNSTAQDLKQQEIKELANQVSAEKANFLAKINQFKSEIDNWKKNHILEAKTSGKIVFNRFINQGQWVEANKPLFYIEAKDKGQYIGEMQIGQYALGKVKEGQSVIVRLNAFPYQEYGILRGKITYLSDMTIADTSYVARVIFNEGKTTSYKKELNLKNGLIADAEIITKNRSLLNKLFSSLTSLVNND